MTREPPSAPGLPPFVRGRGRWHARGRKPGEMNGDERRYAEELERRRLAGEIEHWAFEPEKLRLAPSTFYTPDFRVLMPDGSIEFHEVKGFVEAAGQIKIKVAAELHPYTFRRVRRRTKVQGGGWEIIEIGAGSTDKDDRQGRLLEG